MVTEKEGHMKKNVIISLVSMVALNVVCLSTVTIAWFAAKRTVDNSVDGVVAVDGSIVENVEVFNTADVDYQKGYRYFDKTPSDKLELAEYTLLDKRYQSLIKVTLTGTYSSIEVSAKTSTTTYLGDLENSDLTELKQKGNPLSNITDFYLLTDLSVLVEKGDYYKLTYDEDSTHETLVKSDEKNICTGIKSKVSLGTLDNVSSFYIVMGYNVNSIAQIYSKYLGTDITSGSEGTSIGFTMDYSFHIDDKSGVSNA